MSSLKRRARRWVVLSTAAATALTTVAQPSIVRAATDVWGGPGATNIAGGGLNGNWSDAGNWDPTLPGAADTALFNNSTSPTTISVGGPFSLNNIVFDTVNAAAYTIGASVDDGTLNLTGGIGSGITLTSTVVNTEIINSDLTLGSNAGNPESFSFTNNSASQLQVFGTIQSAVTGLKTITLGGTGTGGTILRGIISDGAAGGQISLNQTAGTTTLIAANTFTGGTTIGGGTLVLSNLTALGATAAAVGMSGGTLDLATDTSAGPYNFNISGPATILSDRATSGAGITQTMGTLSIGGTTLTIGAGGNVASGTAGLSFGATTLTGATTFAIGANSLLTVGATNLAANTLTFTGAGAFAQSGIMSGTGGLTLGPAYSGTATLSQANTFTGPVAINSGTLNYALTAALASGVNYTLNGGTLSDTGGFTLSLATGKTVNVTAPSTINVGSAFPGKIFLGNAQLTGSGALTKTGAGDLQLGAEAGFSGAWTVNGGTLELQATNAAGAATSLITVNSGGEVLTTNVNIPNPITLNGGTISANGTTAGANIFSGPITVTANPSAVALRLFQTPTTGSSIIFSGNLTNTVPTTLNVTAPTAQTLTLTGNDSGFSGLIAPGANATVVLVGKQAIPTGGYSLSGGGAIANEAASGVRNTAVANNAGFNSFYYDWGVVLNSNTIVPYATVNNYAVDQLYSQTRVITRAGVDQTINFPNSGSGFYPTPGVAGFTASATSASDGAMWKGLLNVTGAGVYTFTTSSDDASLVYVDGQLIANDDGGHGITAKSGTITLTAGPHAVVIRYTQGTGGAGVVETYSGPDTGSTAVNLGSIAGSITTGSLTATEIGSMSVTSGTGVVDAEVDTTSASLNLAAGTTLQVISGTVSNYTITGSTTLGGNATLNPFDGSLTFGGAITGPAGTAPGLTVAGPYLTTFGNTNTYTGQTTVTGGQLQLNASGGGAVPGDLLVNAPNANGPVVNVLLDQANQIAPTSNVTVQAGTLDLNGNNNTINTLTLTGGTVQGTGGGTLTVSSTLSLQSGEIDANLAGTFGSGISKTTSGEVLLKGNNTFTGGLNVNAGILYANGTNPLGAAGNAVTVAPGAQLQLAGANTGDNITIGGTGIVNDGALRNLAGISTIASLTTSSTTTLSVDSGELIIAGAFNSAGGTLTKTGVGSLTFASNQSSIPAVNLTAGRLGFSGTQSFGTVTVPANLAYQFDSDPGAGVNVIVPANTAVVGNYAVDQTFLSRISPSSTGSVLLGVNDNNNLSFATTNLALGALGLVKYGGTITPNAAGYSFGGLTGQGYGQNELTVTSQLSGANGLTVNGGILSLPVANTFTGNITVQGASTLAGAGTFRIVDNSAAGNAANTITLNGGTLQLITTSNNAAGNTFGQLGNPIGVGNAGRGIVIGANGGTIDVSALAGGNDLYALMGNISGSGTLTKTGLGFLALTNADTFSGNLVVAANGNQFDVRAGGSLASVASITVNTAGSLNVDDTNGLGQGRQTAFTGSYNANRINATAPITLQGGSFLFTPRGAAASNSENFGALTVGLGQGAVNANSNPTGSIGSVITFSNLTVNPGSTLRFGGNSGTFGAGTAGVPGANNTQVLFTQMGGVASTAQTILPYADIQGVDLAQYSTTLGVQIATYTPFATAGAVTFTNAQIANLTAAGTYTVSGSDVLGLRFGSGNNANVLAFGTGTQQLNIDSGAIIVDNNNQNRDIGTTAIRGLITAGVAGASTPQTLYLHSTNGTLRVFANIIDNGGSAPVTVIKDIDGAATIDAPGNTYSGGTYVLRGTLTADSAGSLGTGAVTVKNSILNLGVAGATSSTAGYTTVDQGEIVLQANTTTATSAYNTPGDVFNIGTGSTIYANSPGAGFGLNSLTRVFTTPSAGGQILLAPGAIVRQNLVNGVNGAGTLMINNLGANADLFFAPGNSGGQLQSITIGTGTPWKGISSDRNSDTWSQGLIYANSDFYLQGLTRDGGYAVLALGQAQTTGSFGIVNNAGKPINAFITGQVTLSDDAPVIMPSNLTFVVTPGAVFQPNFSNSLGFGASNASIVVQAGGTLDPGNFVALGSVVNMPQNMAYPIPSPVNGNLVVEAGGRLLLNDASGIGSTTNGNKYTFNTDSVLELATANAFFGSNNGLISAGQFNYQPGAVIRISADNINKISQFVGGEANGQQVVYEVTSTTHTLTNQTNPFIVAAVGTTIVAPENITISNGGMLTNDSSATQVNLGRGLLNINNGAILAATNQTYFNLQSPFVIPAGASVTIGSPNVIDGVQKLGAIQLNGPNSNAIDPTATVAVANGAQLSFGAANVWSDAANLSLPFAVTNFAPAGATGPQPGNGSSLLLNTTSFTEVMGQLTGNGAVIANTTGTALAFGWGQASDFSSNVVFAGANGQNPGLTKVGTTNLTLTNVSTSNASSIAQQGTLTVGQAGQTSFGQDRVLRGATLALDDATATLVSAGTSQASGVRLGGTVAAPLGSIAPGGGSFVVNGGATNVTETVGTLFNSDSNANNLTLDGDFSFINVNPGSGTLTLLAQTLEQPTTGGVAGQRNGVWVVRSSTVNNAAGTYGVNGVYVPGAGNLGNGLLIGQIPNMYSQGAVVANAGGTITAAAGTPFAPSRGDYLGDPSGTGQGVGFMTEDALLLPGTTVSGSPTVTVPNVTGLTVGMPVSGAGIPAGTTIAAIGTTTITLSANASAAGTNVTLGYIPVNTGMRLLTASEYTGAIENNVSTSINAKLAGSVSTTGDTRVQTLTMTPGSTLSFNGTLPLNQTPSRFLVNSGGILTQAGAASTISGGATSLLQVPGGDSLYLHTLGDLNLNALAFSDTDIVKTEAGTLNVGSGDFTAFRTSLTVEGGTINLGSNNGFYVQRNNGNGNNAFTGVNLFLNGGTLNQNGNSQLVNALSNSNPLPGMGGTVTSNSAATLQVQGGGNFSGAIQGAIALDKVSNNTLLLTSANSYAGSTVVRQGTLQLRDQGTLTGTSNIDLRFGTLLLDDSYLNNVANRVSANISSTGGSISLVGTGGQVATQTFPQLTLAAGLTTINSNPGGGGANVMTFTNLVHNPDTTINFVQNYGFLGTAGNTSTAIRDFVTNITAGNNGTPQALTLTNGIIGGWAIANGDHFATYNATTGVSYYSNTADGYATEESTAISTATATQNVSDGNTTEAIGGHVVNSIRLAPGGGTTLTFTGTGGAATAGPFTIGTGGMITNANQAIALTGFSTNAVNALGSSLTSGTGELDVWVNQNTTTIGLPITGSIDLVKSGPASLTLTSSFTNVMPSVLNTTTTVTVPSTFGLAVGMTVTGTGIPTGDTIATIGAGGTSYTLATAATATATNALTYGTAATIAPFGNSYTGSTYVNAGTLNLNTPSTNGTTVVAIPSANVFIQNATLTESGTVATAAGQINSNANITLTGAGRLNMLNVAGVTETLGSITMNDASGGSNFGPDGLDRLGSQPTSAVNLTSATPITVNNVNPTTSAFIGAFIGSVNFTNNSGSGATLNINAPNTANGLTVGGLNAGGLYMAGDIGSVPTGTGLPAGGLIKAGTGLLVLNPGNTGSTAATITSGSAAVTVTGSTAGLFPGQAVSGTGIPGSAYILSISGSTVTLSAAATAAGTSLTFALPNTFNSPTALTNEFNITNGVVRVDQGGGLGTNFVNTTVQNGAVLIDDSATPLTGSITLNNGAVLGNTLAVANYGYPSPGGVAQSLLTVPGGDTATMALQDYYVPATGVNTVNVFSHLTGSGNLILTGPAVTGTSGAVVLDNPISGTTTGANDYSGTITANVNTILQSQQLLLAPNTSITGDELGTATVVLNGGRLRLRDDFSTTNTVAANQTATYGNNVTLAANSSSFLDANRASATAGTINNTINLGTLFVSAGADALTVDSGNGYAVGFAQIDGSGNLIKSGASQLNINAVASTFTGTVTVAGPLGLSVVPSQGLNFPSASTTIPSLTVNGFYNAAARTLNVSGTLAIGNNAGSVVNGFNGVSTGANVGVVSIPNGATLTAGTLNNNGIIGNSVAIAGTTVTPSAGAISASTLTGSGFYEALNQSLSVTGTLGDSSGIFRVAGNNTVNLAAAGNGTISGVQIQSGTLHVTAATGGIAPFGSTTVNVFGLPATSLGTTATSGTFATLQFDTGTTTVNNLSHNGNIANSGLVRAMGTGVTTVTGTIGGTAVTFSPGLVEGVILGTTTLDSSATRAANPANFGLKPEPRMGQTNVVTQNPISGWSDDTTWVYTGQFFDPNPTFSFAKSIDDSTLVSIDGTTRLLSGSFNTVGSTAYSVGQSGAIANVANANTGTPTLTLGMGPNNDGWHTIEVRFMNGTGGAGSVAQNDFFNNFGFGLNSTGATALDGAGYLRPIDPGNGSLFRTAQGGSGTVQVDAGATLAAGGINLTGLLSLGAAATGGTFTTNTTGTTDNVDALTVTGTTGVAVVNVANAAANLTVNGTGKSDGTGSFTPGTTGLFLPAGVGLTKAGPGTLTVLGTGVTTPTSIVALNAGTLSFANNALGVGGATPTLAQISFTGNSTLQWHDTNTQDISAQLQAIPGGVTAAFDTNGNSVSFAAGMSGGGNVTKAGLGSLALNAPSTYTGTTTVQAGRLLANSTDTTNGSTGPGLVTVLLNGTLGGGTGNTPATIGQIKGGVTINAGGIISAGNAVTTTGQLAIGGTPTFALGSGNTSDTAGNGSTYAWKINDAGNASDGSATGPGTSGGAVGWDQIAMANIPVFSGSGGVVTVEPISSGAGANGAMSSFSSSSPYSWIIATAPTGTFNPIASGGQGLAANFMLDTSASGLSRFASVNGSAPSSYSISSDASGADLEVVYNPAPEPTGLALMSLGAAGLMLRRRRRSIRSEAR